MTSCSEPDGAVGDAPSKAGVGAQVCGDTLRGAPDRQIVSGLPPTQANADRRCRREGKELPTTSHSEPLRAEVECALIYDERCLVHDNGSLLVDAEADNWLSVPHPESAARIARTYELLSAAGLARRLRLIPGREASERELELVHTAQQVRDIRRACATPGMAVAVGPEARAGKGTWEPALLSAGGTLAALDWVLGGTARRAYALLRPPGHHASKNRAMGFCLFNNVAIAARHAQRVHGVERVAIIDWDVHHGNGTQDVFYADPSVLFISLHQDALYPADTGSVDEIGDGAGRGRNLNIPLPAGTGDQGYRLAFSEIVVPALQAFGPELILISAGQDPAASDPLGRMSVTTEGFRAMADYVCEVADQVCGGRVLAVQEGGYSADHMPYCVLAIVERLAGLEPRFARDPLEIDAPASIRPWERHAVTSVAATLERLTALRKAS